MRTNIIGLLTPTELLPDAAKCSPVPLALSNAGKGGLLSMRFVVTICL